MLKAKITNFSYQKCWRESLPSVDLPNSNLSDFSTIFHAAPSKFLAHFGDKTLAISKWVSPKRTRSYPYARVYNTFDAPASKVATIIPLIKDEGAAGDMDYLQWDTLSLMSLLNVYVIVAFYDKAELNPTRKGKITNQKFNAEHILQQLNLLKNYHQSALHWNLNQLSEQNLAALVSAAKNAYASISRDLAVPLHPAQNIDKFAAKITQNKNEFMAFSRAKAQRAQNAEANTTQPKEQIGIGAKSKIVIENYLGGQYFFTIDDVLQRGGVLHLCESKHSKNALLPSVDDIKDGLLKLMLYNNLAEIQGVERFKVVLRLTSSLLRGGISLPSVNLSDFLASASFSKAQISTLNALNAEAAKNKFEIWINDER